VAAGGLVYRAAADQFSRGCATAQSSQENVLLVVWGRPSRIGCGRARSTCGQKLVAPRGCRRFVDVEPDMSRWHPGRGEHVGCSGRRRRHSAAFGWPRPSPGTSCPAVRCRAPQVARLISISSGNLSGCHCYPRGSVTSSWLFNTIRHPQNMTLKRFIRGITHVNGFSASCFAHSERIDRSWEITMTEVAL
jgi:hypothetical protein